MAASKMQAIQKQLDAAAGKSSPPAPAPEPRPAEESRQAVNANRKASPRDGKKHVGAHLPPAFTTNLLMAKAKTGKKIETLIAEALNDLFRRHNLPVIEEE